MRPEIYDIRDLKGADSSRAGLEAEHGAGIQDNGILLLSLSMQRKRHFASLFPFLSLCLLYQLR